MSAEVAPEHSCTCGQALDCCVTDHCPRCGVELPADDALPEETGRARTSLS